MKYLLDTHTFIWWIEDNSRLSKNSKDIIKNNESDLFFSVASIWEMMIKVKIKKYNFLESQICSSSDNWKQIELSSYPLRQFMLISYINFLRFIKTLSIECWWLRHRSRMRRLSHQMRLLNNIMSLLFGNQSE